MLNTKDKGNRGEREWAEKLVQAGLDKYARRMPRSGAIPGLRADIHTNLPINFEVKNQESWSPRKYYEQAKGELNVGSGRIPVVVLKSNLSPYFVFLDGDDFITILSFALKAGYPDDRIRAEQFVEKVKVTNPYKQFHPVPKPQNRHK